MRFRIRNRKPGKSGVADHGRRPAPGLREVRELCRLRRGRGESGPGILVPLRGGEPGLQEDETVSPCQFGKRGLAVIRPVEHRRNDPLACQNLLFGRQGGDGGKQLLRLLLF